MYSFGDTNDNSGNKAIIGSLIAGLVFGAAWWLWIDGTAYGAGIEDNQASKDASGYSWIMGVVSTIAFVMINGMNWADLKHEEDSAQRKAKLFLLIAIILQLGSLCVAAYVMADVFLNHDDAYDYTGVAIFGQNMLILLATYIMRMSTMPPADGGGMW